MTNDPARYFVYGTLLDSERVDRLLDDWAFEGAARLEGLHVVSGRYPTLAPGGETDGRLLRTAEHDRLDAYERTDRGLYVRVRVPVASGGVAVVYVGDPESLDVSVDWPGTGPLDRCVRDYLADADVRVVPR